ncbi:MAG: homogentisate 1,2-dioxygenase [Bacteroidia bacterium]|nr:homogentisate 1,2-dioxygenase [Bacteroidia bacterium]
MSVYQRFGKIPQKRHVVFRKENGDLYCEELVGTEGFSGNSSLVYHLHPPTMVTQVGKPYSVAPDLAESENLRARSFLSFNQPYGGDFLSSRKVYFQNAELTVGVAAPSMSMQRFFKNADADEMLFIHEGRGILHTMFGEVGFAKGDYLIIPRGTVYKIEFESEKNRLLVMESYSPISIPQKYRTANGQMMEHAPFCERDLRGPAELKTFDQAGKFEVLIKKKNMIYPYEYAWHPFDVVGWDGYHYPFAFSIYDFEPITGRIHMPPPVHMTFEGAGFVICSFVPRMYDYHPEAIPAPYYHSNIDSDEILYYVDGDFMSRNNIHEGQFTLHPGGIPHGPHPGAIERSIGVKNTEEYAVMIDPFRPVQVTRHALETEVDDYSYSWLGKE